jgi:hypothetical protein
MKQSRSFLYVGLMALMVGLVLNQAAAGLAAPPHQSDTRVAEVKVLGTAPRDLEARYLDGTTCSIGAGETLLAVGDSGEGLLVYASGAGCEGLVVLAADAEWENERQLANLAAVEINIEAVRTITSLPDYNTVCSDATPGGSFPAGGPPYTIFVNNRSVTLAEAHRPTTVTGVDLVVCEQYLSQVVETCTYIGAGIFYVDRVRVGTKVMLVNYETHGIVAQQNFYGEWPRYCPQTIYSTADIYGLSPDPATTWVPWVQQRAGGGRAPVTRTVVNSSGQLNCRNEPGTTSEILTKIDRGTPVNLIARNEAGDWVVALIPDMTHCWLSLELLRVAARTDPNSLPVAAGPAADVLIVLP